MGIEALQLKHFGTQLPAGAGGQLGKLLAHAMSLSLGATGCTLLLLVFMAVGASLFFGFSWLHVFEKVGTAVEKSVRRLFELKAAREDRKVGETKSAERNAIVVAQQKQFVHEDRKSTRLNSSHK